MLEMELRGSPYEIGLQHGRRAADLVRRFHRCVLVDKVTQGFRGKPQGTREDFRNRVRAVEANMRAALPDYLEEMRGIADGAGLTYEEILELNFSTEGWGQVLKACTSLAVTTTDGEPLLAHTEDDDEGDDEYLIVQRISPEKGQQYVKVGVAGTLWTSIGINAAGLTYAGSGLALQPGVSNWAGLPPMVAHRELLVHKRTVGEALDWLGSVDFIGHGGAFSMIDADGGMAVVEKVPTNQAVRGPEDGTVFTVNEAACPAIRPLTVNQGALIDNSRARVENLNRLLGTTPHTVEGMQTMMSDHAVPGAICQHGQDNLYTVHAGVASPRERTMWVTQGYPCQNPFVAYTV